jgi:hypothetical protein
MGMIEPAGLWVWYWWAIEFPGLYGVWAC